MTYGSIDKSKDKITLNFTKGEVLFIRESLQELRNNIGWRQSAAQYVMKYEDVEFNDDCDYDAQLQVLEKMIIKFETA